jgi:hypothetical protein
MLKAHDSTTKMEEISFSEALVTAYMTIRRHNRDDYIQNISFKNKGLSSQQALSLQCMTTITCSVVSVTNCDSRP